MKIVHLASELAPIAKVGGLGDVVYGLCKSLIAKNHEAEVILPKYDLLDLDSIENLKVVHNCFSIFFNGHQVLNTIWKGWVDKIAVFFIEPDDSLKFFNCSTIYGCENDSLRFVYFCHVALKYLLSEMEPDVVHLHDWHTAFAAPLIKKSAIPTVLTIHNLAYQGICDLQTFEKVGWNEQGLNELKQTEHSNSYNLLKGGIVFADRITTVSPTYAKEILKAGPLQMTLQKYQRKVSGILNGIDVNYWNPETDPLLPFHYHLKQFTEDPPFLKGKEKIKKYLRTHFKLADRPAPLVSSVTRLVAQKGPKLIQSALSHTLKKGGQFVLLGSTFDETTQAHFAQLKRKLAHSPDIHMELIYDEKLAHLAYAASDLFIAPSLFEPCGLTPLIAMRYGAVPLVRQTGGMKDTVFDGKNGFSFNSPTPVALHRALNRAFSCWANHPTRWAKLMKQGMEEDFSWNRSAEAYLKIYRELLSVNKRIT